MKGNVTAVITLEVNASELVILYDAVRMSNLYGELTPMASKITDLRHQLHDLVLKLPG